MRAEKNRGRRTVFACVWLIASLAQAEELAFFETRIWPVLVEHCYECHSAAATKPKGGLRLDLRETLRRGGDCSRSA